MLGFRFRTPPDKTRQKAATRLSTLAPSEVLSWADVAMSDAWRALDAYRKDPQPDALEDMETALQQILGAVDVLRERS